MEPRPYIPTTLSLRKQPHPLELQCLHVLNDHIFHITGLLELGTTPWLHKMGVMKRILPWG